MQSDLVFTVLIVISELYGPKFNDPETKKRFQYLLQSVENQVLYMKKMMEVQGIIKTILTSTFLLDDEETVLTRPYLKIF